MRNGGEAYRQPSAAFGSAGAKSLSREAQGMGADSLMNKTATALLQASSQSQMRLEMIARTIAETGVRDLFNIIHALTLKHSTRGEKLQLRDALLLLLRSLRL